MQSVLFLAKRRYDYAGENVTSGVVRSVALTVWGLRAAGVSCFFDVCTDANDIDRVVTETAASVVIIDALWVTPDKMRELLRLHPGRKWVVRIHSELPFLATEGISMEWLGAYRKMGVILACNSRQCAADLYALYLPNMYTMPMHPMHAQRRTPGAVLNVGCFGAIRPLKNHLTQAVAAYRFARSRKQRLRFHVNSGRIEQGGAPVLQSLRGFFANVDAELVTWPWLSGDDLPKVIRTMDICMQVSLSETFNLVTADSVSLGIPTITSRAVRWMPEPLQCSDPGSTDSIVRVLELLDGDYAVISSQTALRAYNRAALSAWHSALGGGFHA